MTTDPSRRAHDLLGPAVHATGTPDSHEVARAHAYATLAVAGALHDVADAIRGRIPDAEIIDDDPPADRTYGMAPLTDAGRAHQDPTPPGETATSGVGDTVGTAGHPDHVLLAAQHLDGALSSGRPELLVHRDSRTAMHTIVRYLAPR